MEYFINLWTSYRCIRRIALQSVFSAKLLFISNGLQGRRHRRRTVLGYDSYGCCFLSSTRSSSALSLISLLRASGVSFSFGGKLAGSIGSGENGGGAEVTSGGVERKDETGTGLVPCSCDATGSSGRCSDSNTCAGAFTPAGEPTMMKS